MRILITGGSGFIGSNFIRHLYHAHPDAHIWNLDLLTYAGNPDNLLDIETTESKNPETGRRYTFIKGDIADRELVERLFREQGFDTVFNFAAESHVDRSIIASEHFIRTNIQGTHALLDAARKYKTPRFIQISTDEVYGDLATGSADEKTLLRPSSPYSASKAGADFLAQAYVRTYKLPALIVRGTNNFGPHQYPEKLMPLAITSILTGEKIPVHGSGLHVRSWLFVKDFCDAIDAIWQKGHEGEIYNVGGTEKNNLEIVSHVASHMEKNPDEWIIRVADRPGQDIRYSVTHEKLIRHTGWIPKHDFAAALKETVNWYLANQGWWKKIRNTAAFTDHLELQSKGIWF